MIARRFWYRLQRLLPVLAAALLVGCDSRWRLPSVTYIAVGVGSDELIDSELRRNFQDRVGLLATGFQQLHPGSNLQFSFYPEDQIVEVMRRRNRQGLGPDLLVVNGGTARQLMREGLIDPFPADAKERNAYDGSILKRIQLPDGQLVGLPLVIAPQLSCFNRDRLPDAPATLQELLAAGGNGATVGLPIDLRNLLWTTGSLGAVEAFTQAVEQRPLSPVDRQGLFRWFRWLQNASLQQRVVFYASQPLALEQLVNGTLDWIPCRSFDLPSLRQQLGARLGVAPLPNGDNDGLLASPINQLRLWSLGHSSSRAGRARALAFSRYSLNPLSQRNLTLGTLTVLPANRFVTVPVQSSSLLAAMVAANAQGSQTNRLVADFDATDQRPGAIQALVTGVVFGEQTPAAASRQAEQILGAPR